MKDLGFEYKDWEKSKRYSPKPRPPCSALLYSTPLQSQVTALPYVLLRKPRERFLIGIEFALHCNSLLYSTRTYCHSTAFSKSRSKNEVQWYEGDEEEERSSCSV